MYAHPASQGGTSRRIVLGAAMVLLAAGTTRAGEKAPPLNTAGYTLSGAYTHENLTVFLVHGTETLKGAAYLTLEEAMQQKKVIVHETGNVNELTVENVSSDSDV